MFWSRTLRQLNIFASRKHLITLHLRQAITSSVEPKVMNPSARCNSRNVHVNLRIHTYLTTVQYSSVRADDVAICFLCLRSLLSG